MATCRLTSKDWSAWNKMKAQNATTVAAKRAMAMLDSKVRETINIWRRQHGKPEVK